MYAHWKRKKLLHLQNKIFVGRPKSFLCKFSPIYDQLRGKFLSFSLDQLLAHWSWSVEGLLEDW